MDDLTRREIELIEAMGIMRHALELADTIYTCLTVRCGGAVTITSQELDFVRKNYSLEKTLRSEDLTSDIKLATRLK